MKKKLFILSNESIYSAENKFFCDNLDLKSTPEGLNKKFEVNLLGRKSGKKRGGGASKGLMRKWNEKRGKIKETPLNHVERNVEDKHNIVYKLFKKYHGQVEDFQEKGKSRSKGKI